MWFENKLTERLNLKWPILQAPMGDLTTPGLASEVSNSGGLGGLGMWGFSASDAERRIAGFRQMSGGGLNVNYPLWDDPGDCRDAAPEMQAKLQALSDELGLGPLPEAKAAAGVVDAAHLEVLVSSRPEVVSFHFGLPPKETLSALQSAGIFVICSATTVDEARRLEQEGVDAVIAQGTEAGGHRGTFTGIDISMQPGLFALLPQVADAVSVPVIAAGGIADGRGIAAAMMLGASGVQVGTAFLRCVEAAVKDAHREALAEGNDASSVVSDVMTGRPARFIKNRLIEELSGTKPFPFPAQGGQTGHLTRTGKRELSGLYSGQSVALTREMPAGKLVETLAEEATEQLARFSGGT